ncbi:MAG TPA: hypothetical protein VJ577_16905 [Burkholderiaceae bacterium]|nr:hypothetical protein [Burkholderiaceae bacterium]
MRKHNDRLVLVRYLLAIEIVRLTSKLVALLGMIFNYSSADAATVGHTIPTETRYLGVCSHV